MDSASVDLPILAHMDVAVVAVALALVVVLLVVIALLMGRISALEGKNALLAGDLVEQAQEAVARERAILTDLRDSQDRHTQATVEIISKAVKDQTQVMQESMKTAWNPNPAPANPLHMVGNPAVDKILAKYGYSGYNLPTPADVQEHDMGEDPTDQYLQETAFQRHQGAAMIPANDIPEVDNPTGIPGFKAAW